MPLRPIAILLQRFSFAFPGNKKIEDGAVQIIKKLGIPPAMFRVLYKNKTLKIFSANPNVRGEIFIHRQNILMELRKKFRDISPETRFS